MRVGCCGQGTRRVHWGSGWDVGSWPKEVKPPAPYADPSPAAPLGVPPLPGRGELRQAGAAARLSMRRESLPPRQYSLCLALPPFSSLWPGSQVAVTFLSLASRPERVCVSKVVVILGPGLVSNLMWSLWPGRVINAGKSRHNEDQACCEVVYVEGRRSVSGAPREPSRGQSCWSSQKEVTHESLVIGAIENAFQLMDEQMARERRGHQVEGGCCALVVIYLLGKVYVANAGDSRAIIVRNGEIIPMSREFTPETERQRLQLLGFLKPELLGGEFTHLEFPRRVQPKELGQKMLYRDQNMTGWAYKKIELEDLRFPLVCGEGKKARVMATIGVTRGLGDHNLKVCSSTLPIKPFLSCFPEVQVYDLTQYEHCPDDVLVLGTDGLWDVTSDCEVAATVDRVLSAYEPNDPSRYTALAQALVLGARGTPRDRGWRLPNNKLGSGDDISVFIIPLGGPGSYS
ncbi:protein phosphatase 1J isoform X4 [Diceros bicornis minor]|uniref:protein phosphatase 1J isoform X4 n=1 Tax=Diceros bicornis minor TaxID=77932 RepID=UPI0026F08A16|nr:protein phosphatase 1J isoform X4 [Diceros bicornis minor]